MINRRSRAAANIRLKEIFEKGALTVIRTVVLASTSLSTSLSNSCDYTNSCASNPPFQKTSLIPSSLSAILWRQC